MAAAERRRSPGRKKTPGLGTWPFRGAIHCGGEHGGTGFRKALSVRTFRGTSGETSSGLYIYLELKVRLEIQAQKTAAVGMKPWWSFLKTSA